MTGLIVLVVAVAAALAVGFVLRARAGRVRPEPAAAPGPAAQEPGSQEPGSQEPAATAAGGGSGAGAPPAGGDGAADGDGELALLRAAGLRSDGPTVVHFSAPWCGPCAAVRRVVADTAGRLAHEDPAAAPVHDLELDLDEYARLARLLRVMSLPTTFLYDAAGTRHGRIAGVPAAAELADALRPLRGPAA